MCAFTLTIFYSYIDRQFILSVLRYCMRTLNKNIEWLHRKLATFDGYLLIDLPGQLELYSILQMEKWGHRVVTMHLSDSMYCSDAGKFISVVLSALAVTVNLEAAQVNVLSKMDLIKFFKELPDLSKLTELVDENAMLSRYKAMNQSICSLINDFDLVSFIGVDVNCKKSMLKVLNAADMANGFALVECESVS
uniref:GPN-loop GTPase 2 n=1 Tax=Parascaris equorum TaxID=6256 RepID=A0A914R7J2_PAREQ